jgi:hypothetical protein
MGKAEGLMARITMLLELASGVSENW